MVIQIYQYINNQRTTSVKQYNSYEDYERDYLLMKLSGTWVGHRVFDIELDEFLTLNETEINNLPCKRDFDRKAFLGGSYDKYYNGAKK